MGEKSKLTLSSVLESFEKSLTKEAGEETKETEETPAKKVDSETPADAVTDAEKTEKKKNDGDTDDAAAEATPDNEAGDTDDAAAQKEKNAGQDVVTGLKAIAKTASENSEKAMEKEAQEFGRLFAHAVIEEMEKNAQEQDEMAKVAARAYEVMENELFQVKLAQVFEEAYTLAGMKCISSEAYEKTASALKTTAGSQEAISAAHEMEQLKGVVKQAYDLTQEYLDSNQ